MAKSKNTKTAGFNILGRGTASSFNATPVDKIKRSLYSADGKYFGEVGFYAHEAITGGKLDSYTPKEDEADVINNFRKYPGISLQAPNGASYGNISYDTYNALLNGKLDENKLSASEKAVVEEYKNDTGFGKTYFDVKEQYEKNRFGNGNIDLTSRPRYKNSDGTISTVASMSINEDGKEILIPTVVKDKNGKAKKLSEEEAIKHYHETGEYLGKFDSVNEANKYAQRLHVEQDLYYDFLENSTYKPTKNNKKVEKIYGDNHQVYYSETGFDDIEHDYINGNKTAIDIVTVNEVATKKVILGTDSSFLKEMKPEEIATYNYLYNVYGKEAGKKYIKDISSDLNLRQRLNSQAEMSKWAKESGFSSSAATILTSPMKVYSAVGQLNDYLGDGKIDQNAGYNKYVYNTNAIRTTVSDEIKKGWSGQVGSFLYNTGMSIGDSMVNTVASGGNKFLSLGTMGVGAFADRVVSAKDRGLSDDQAIGLGFASAAAEIVTESFSFDALFSAKNVGKTFGKGATKASAGKYILDNIKTNALEEMGADGINLVADVLISKDKSEWQESVNAYKEKGYSDSKAWGMAFANQVGQIVLSGLAGALSGGVTSSTGGMFIASKLKAIGSENKSNASHIISEALGYDKSSEAYKNALKLSATKTEISDYSLGRQVLLNDAYKTNEIIGTGLKFDKKSEAYKNAKKLLKSDNITAEDLAYQVKLNNAMQGVKAEENTIENTTIDVSETPTVNVGETFVENSTGKAIKVVDRNDTATTVEITANGKTETKQVPNNTADRLATEDRYNKLETTPEPTESATPTPIAEDVTTKKTINLKRWGDNYEVYGEEAVALADELGDSTETTVVNGVETEVLRVPADKMVEASVVMGDEFNFVFSDRATNENSPVTSKNATTEETTPIAEESATEVKIIAVTNAVDETLLPEARKGVLDGVADEDKARRLYEFSGKLTEIYEKSGSLGNMARFFSDNGAKVIAAMEGKAEVVETTNVETPTVAEMSPVESSNNNEELNSLYEQRDELNNLVEAMKNQGVEQSEIDKTKELVAEVETEIARLEQKDSKPEALTNKSESATIKEKAKPNTESKTVEREDGNNERRRESVLPKNSGRGDDGGTRKQISRLSSFERRNQGKNEAERKSFTRELVDRGQVENVNDGKCEYTLVKPEAYNDDMSSMVKDAKSKGVDLGFMVGNARVLQIDGEDFYVDGIKFNSSKVIVRYDGGRPPQKIAKHEMIHAKWNTPEVQKAKNTILDSLTEEKKQEILSQERYARYKSEAYNGSEEIALEEFVCDVMAGMNKYTIDHIDTVDNYWNENESADTYKVAEYSESTDAGGEARYSMYSYPRLNNSEWALLNRRLEIEIGNEDNFIDEHTKWLYASKNGTRVFAIYGIGRGDDATPLYAVGGKKAEKKYNEMLFFMEEENEEYTGNKEDFESWLSNYIITQGSTGNNISDDGNRKTSAENGSVHSEQQASSGKGIDGRGAENSNEVNHSLKDSTGRKLSKGQVEYFKDSKVRDNDGNLKVMYRGDKENFTVFDKKKTSHSNMYGRGFYFTDSKSHAEQYGDAREYYLDIKNPLSPKQNVITKKQMLNFLKAIENDGEDYDLYNYGEGATAESVLKSVWGKGDFEMLQDVSASAIGDLVAAVELFNEVNGTSYDGIVLPTETVTFESEQAKFTSNLNPTTDKDVRFSFAEPVEETKNLVAVHNLSPEKLLKTLKLGGLPMPSIAITRAREGYNNFGAISLVFGKETIDPKFFRSNKVYSGDAWTPTYPQIAYKLNAKTQEQIKKKIDALVPSKVRDDLGGLHLDSTNMEYELNRSGDMVQAYRYNYAMKYAFLKDKGTDIELPTKAEPLYIYGEVSNEAVISFAHKMVDGLKTVNSLLEQHSSKLMADTDLINGIATVLNEDALSSVEEKSERYQMLVENPLFKAEDIDLSTVLGMLEAARKYFHTNGKVDSKVDYKEARTIIDENVDMAEYEAWLKELFADVVAKEGIRNNKDLFTPSGNRRSFEVLHYEHNLENVIKAMKEQGTKGIGGFGGGNIFGASTNEYSSIEEIKADAKNRMQQLPESKYDEIKKGFSDRFFELANSLPIHKDSFSALDDAANMLIEAVSKFKTKSGMANYLRAESKGWANYSEHIVDDLIELVNDIRNMPVAYFEAKPQRAVGYDEIRAVIMPAQESYEDDLTEIKSELEKIGVPILEYEYGDNNDRIKALNSVEDVRFSFAEKDSEYLELAKDPVKNEARLMELVDAKAVESGVDTDSNGKPIGLYHGTSDFGFTTVDTEYSDDKLTFWATSELAVAKSYHGHGFGFKPHEGVRQIGNPTEIVKNPKLDAQKDSATKIVETAAEVFPEYKDATVLTDKQKLKEAKKDIASAYKTAKKLMKSKELTEADAEFVGSFIDAVNEGTCEALTEACDVYEKVDTQRANSWFDDDVSAYEERFQILTEKMEEIYEVVRPDYVLFDGDVLYTSYIAARYNAETGNSGVYKFYYKAEKPYVIDCKGENWNRIETPAEISPTGERMNTRQIARWAFENGYDSVKYVNAVDMGSKKVDSVSATVWAFMNPKEQLKSADPVTYDDNGNVIPLDERFNKKNKDLRWSFSENNNLETQKKIESIAEDIGSHDELIDYAKKNTKEFVAKIKENKSLQTRLDNAKRQTSLSPTPVVNVTKAGNITKEILNEMESTLKATDLRGEVMSIYNEYFDAMKKAKNVKSKVQEANDNMLERFGRLAVDIVDSSVAYTESEEHELLKSYVKNTRINIPEDAKGEAHYAEFRKSHMGTFNLTNDGLPIDRAYQELCELFPGLFSEEVTAPADQLNAIAEALESTKPYAYNPHKSYMADAVDHVVYRFASEVDGLAVVPKTKAQKIAEKGAYDKNMALDKERTEFARKLDKHKEQSENTIRKLQKKIDDAKYVGYWEKRLSKEEKAQALKELRDKRDIANLKSKIRNIVSDMKKNLDKTEKAGGYPKELVKAAADVCSVLDFHTDRTGKNGAPTKASLKLDALKMQYDALKNNPNYDLASEYNEELSDKILKLNEAISGKRVVDLNKAELTNLKDILSEISTRLSEASKQIGQANAKANIEIATEIINSMKLDNKAISEIRNQLLKEMRLAKESGKAFVINPHRIFEMIANYDRDSAWWQLYDQILRGSRNAAKFTMDATMPFDELTDGAGNEIAFYDFRTKTHKTGIKYQDGTDVELPKSIICELVMLWDRKQGRNHLETGGVKIPDLKLFNKGKTADALASGKMTNAITQADITRLKGMLDSYDKAWIEKSRHLFNKVAKDAINGVSMQLVGREIAKADNYIRIYVDSDFVKKDIGKDEPDITIEGHGSLKETTPDAKNPLVVRGLHENVYEHIDFAAKYYGLAIPIRNFNKVYKISINNKGNFDSVKNALGSVYGPKIRDGVVVQVIKDLQAPRHRELSVFNKVKGGWLSATFWANIRSTLKQTTSYWTSSSILDEGSLVKGLASYVAHRKQTKAEINKYSGTLYKRSQGLSTTELGDRANRKRLAGLSSKTTKLINTKLPILRKIPEWIRPGNWLQSMDCAVSSALWDACKHQVSKTMKATDDGYMEAVRDLYERVIEETQSNYDMLHRPEILKSTNMTWQTVGMFQNDNLQQTGIMYSALGDLRAKKKAYEADKSSANEQKLKDAKKRMGKAVRSRVYSSVWLVAVSMLGDAILRKFKPYIDDEEKEISANSVLEQAMLNMSEDMLGVAFPVVGQLATKAMDTFGEGYDFLNDPAFDVLEDFIKATSKIYKAYDEDGDVLKAWTDAIPAISNMTGIPAKNISDLYNGIKGYIGDIKAGEFAHDLTDYSGGKSFYNYGDLASYIVSGDKEKEKKLLDYYSENGKEIAKGSLTQEIKPAYVQMYIDSPKEAYNLKRKLILEYDYSEETIGNWTIAEYFKHAIPGKKYDDDVISNPEYASEIASAVQGEKNWRDSYYSTIRSKYKTIYKKGEEADTEALKKALIQDFKIPANDIRTWESEADKALKKSAEEREAEKKKYK